MFAKLGVKVGVRDMTATAHAFGFNDNSLRIPFSVARSTFDPTVDKAQLALSSIGQYNTRATPLQMAMVSAAVANGGQIRTPYLVERTTTDDGDTVATAGSRPVRQAMYPATAARLKELMAQVVTEGTGTNAAIPGAVVGGKTGTAQHGIGNSGRRTPGSCRGRRASGTWSRRSRWPWWWRTRRPSGGHHRGRDGRADRPGGDGSGAQRQVLRRGLSPAGPPT